MTSRKTKTRSRSRLAPEPETYEEDETVEEPEEDPGIPVADPVELLGDIRDLLIHLLRQSSCPKCRGGGVVPAPGSTREAPRFDPCGCRLEARVFLENYVPAEGEAPEGEPPSEEAEPDDDEP